VHVASYNPITGKVSAFRLGDNFNEDYSPLLNPGDLIVSVDRNKLRDEDVIWDAAKRDFVLKKPLNTNVLTPGIKLRTLGAVPTVWPTPQLLPGVHAYMDDVLPENISVANKMHDIAKQVAPAFERILKDIGMDPYGVAVIIGDNLEQWTGVSDETTPALVIHDSSQVWLSPKNFLRSREAAGVGTGQLEIDVPETIAHEIGHLVTYNYFKKLPTEIQSQLFYAWNKANLANRMSPMQSEELGSVKADTLAATNPIQREYYLTFPEWLTEQFRRWTFSAATPRSYMDRSFAEGGRMLNTFFDLWEKQFGRQSRRDLEESDYAFSALMNYLRDFGSEKAALNQLLKQQAVLSIQESLLDSPATIQVASQVQRAVESMTEMFPEPVRVAFQEKLSPSIHASANAVASWDPQLSLIELAIGSMKPETAFNESRVLLTHEVMHSYEDLRLITPQEIAILDRDIASKKGGLSSGYKQALKLRVQGFAQEQNAAAKRAGQPMPWSPERIQAKYEEMLAREARAYYIQEFADTGIAQSAEARDIMTRLLAILERVRNFLQGLGYQSRDDVLRAFFKGEMAARYDRGAAKHEQSVAQAMHHEAINQGLLQDLRPPDKSWQVGELFVNAYYEGSTTASPYIFYHWLDASGKLVGLLELQGKEGKGYTTSWIQSDSFMLAPQMLGEAEKDIGMPLKLAGELTEAGYKQAGLMLRKKGEQDLLSFYQPVVTQDGKKYWVSPNHVTDMMNVWIEIARSPEKLQQLGITQKRAIENIARYKKLRDKLPKAIWTDPRLEKMFSLPRGWHLDETAGSLQRGGMQADESRLLASIGVGDARPEAFAEAMRLSQHFSQAENAKASGLRFEDSAPSTMLTYEALNLRKLWERGTGYGEMPVTERELKNQRHQADRIGKFTKYFWGLHQLAWRNEHIIGLRMYLQHAEQMNQLATRWLKQADETAREWERVKSPERREAIAEAFFALSEMKYRLPSEVKAEVTRLPANWDSFLAGMPPVPGGELDRLFKSVKVKSEDYAIIRRVQKDFMAFLDEVEAIRNGILLRIHSGAKSAEALRAAQAKLQAEMAEYRQKPYFPMVRFGEYILTIRDPADSNKVVWSGAFERQNQRSAAIKDLRKEYPTEDFIIGRVPDSASEFQSLPGPLLQMIKENLLDPTGKTPEQQALIAEQVSWIEQFEMQQAPDRSFRKRWLPSKGLPGYSTDAFKAYAHYFQNGARYLSRLAFMDQLQSDINLVAADIRNGLVGNTSKRQAILRYMSDHFRYIMEGGQDSGKFRAWASLWFLGFSPMAAGMNLTQIPMVLIPTLKGHFGKGYESTFSKALSALKETAGVAHGTPGFQAARLEMINQGRIDVGQAPEVAAFAEGYNLNKLLAGTGAEKAWRAISYYGMKMFGAVERFNRELTLKAAWDLALQNKGRFARWNEIDLRYPIELADLQRRVGFTHDESIAFLFAKEMIDRTQFQYAKYTDPPYQRGEIAKNLLIFMKYTQSYLYALRFNGASFRMLMMMAFVYGLSGLPGMDEFNEALRLIMQKIFGKDYDLKMEARGAVRAVTKGTIFDEVGPDLFMHGISRYSFGFGLLPEGWAVPRFDASANGSMGRLVPGLSEYMHGVNTKKEYAEVFAESAQRAGGAGYGYFMSLAQFMMSDPWSQDWKKWEQLTQRQAKAMLKAYRYYNEGAETTRSGAKIVKFDVTDPEDLTTIVGQALGATPTRVSQTWDLIRASRETMQIYQAERSMIYAQLDKAVRDENSQAMDDVFKAIEDYNERVLKLDPNMAINARQVTAALRNRAKSRALQEEFLAPTKREVLVTDRLRDLFPGVKVQNVK